MDYRNLEAEGECPVSMEALGKFYRADPALVCEMVSRYSQHLRARLALFCYARQHFRDVGLAIAAHCDAQVLIQLAGEAGRILASQSMEDLSRFGRRDMKQIGLGAKVSLGGAQAA